MAIRRLEPGSVFSGLSNAEIAPLFVLPYRGAILVLEMLRSDQEAFRQAWGGLWWSAELLSLSLSRAHSARVRTCSSGQNRIVVIEDDIEEMGRFNGC
jgi:hypothetical protein